MKKQIVTIGFGAVLAYTSAFAGQITQTITIPTTSLDFTSTLGFTKFDPTLGALNDIQFISTVSASDTTIITNTSGRSRTFTFSSSVDLRIIGEAGPLVYDELIPLTSQSVTLADNQTGIITATSAGSATTIYTAPGGALTSYTGSSANGTPANPIDTTPFIGAGQGILLDFDAGNNSTVRGGSNNASSFGTASGSLAVIYDYSPATTVLSPEPATSLLVMTTLLGVGLAGCQIWKSARP